MSTSERGAPAGLPRAARAQLQPAKIYSNNFTKTTCNHLRPISIDSLLNYELINIGYILLQYLVIKL